MKEKTLHYPGYATRINLLKECGFFSNEYIKINRIKIKQVDFTVNLLFSLCHLEENEEEFTILNIKIIGKEGDQNCEYLYHLLDSIKRLK